MEKDLYEVLGVTKSASDAEIKKAYRVLAREYHPDINKDDPNAEKKFKEIQKSYDILSNEQKRAQYDQYGITDDQQAGAGGFGAGFGGFEGFEDIFDSFFSGNRRQSSQRSGVYQGEDLRYDLELKLEEVIKKTEQQIEIYYMDKCEPCRGTGAKNGDKTSCQDCGGQGQIQHVQQTMLGSFSQVTTCPRCEGTGSIIKSPCGSCSGSGVKKVKNKINVDIPAGVETGVKLRMEGKGNAGRGGGPRGDLYIFISVKNHAYFEREDDNVLLEIDIPMTQAVMGTSVKLPTLDGGSILKIPEGTQPGTTFRLKGKGIPHLRGFGCGDQLVKVNVSIPKQLNKEDQQLVITLSKRLNDAKRVENIYAKIKG